MAHVFIVDDQTFPVHLKYSFAGTGAKEYKCEFLQDEKIYFQSTIERLLTGMIADISRIRIGDDIIFYLQQSNKHDGMFFGCFKAASVPFLSSDDYLKDDLGKNLTFRILLEPSRVFAKGATERDCLDSLKGINHPSEMCWSLIYRKLKGNRGCTMITDAEYRHIVNKLEQNNASALSSNTNAYPKNTDTRPDNVNVLPNGPLTFDPQTYEIKIADSDKKYAGKKSSLEIKNRLFHKYSLGQAYETHLQAYISQHLEEISGLSLPELPISWIGNEVSCGVGMQSIDIMFAQENDEAMHFTICELKDEQLEPYIKEQIKKYIDWIKDYLAPLYTKKVIIHPTIVAPKPNEKSRALFEEIKNVASDKGNVSVSQMRYLGFEIADGDLTFSVII